MKNYIYDAMWSQDLEDAIEADKAKPLIMEMYYKYGFKAYAMSSHGYVVEEFDQDTNTWGSTHKSVNKYMMTLDGLPYCQVYVDDMSPKKTDYCFYSPYFEKERGRDRQDKRTIRSAKISGLMRMLDKYKCVVDTPERVLGADALHYIYSVTYQNLSRAARHSDKPQHPSRQQYEVLEAYMTGKKLPTEKNEELKKLFDIWSKEVETERHALDKVKTMFGNEFYIIAESCQGEGLCIGKGKFNFIHNEMRNVPFEITDSFQRIKSIDEVDDSLKTMLTMYKVWEEINTPSHYKVKDKILSHDTGYIKDLDMVITHSNHARDFFGMNVLIIPMETE